MIGNLTFRAGKKALTLIRGNGLTQEMVKVLAGASGGPKWIVLSGLDRVLISYFKNRKDPLFLIGSSIGAWRFAAFSLNDQIKAIDIFESEYIHQSYLSNIPTPDEISGESFRILNSFLGDNGVKEILNHPFMRLNVLAVRSKWPVASEHKIPQSFGLLGTIIFNLVNRKLMKYFFERALFYDSRDIPPFYDMEDFPIKRYSLTEDNLKSAVLASGSIPLIMKGVQDISGASKGVYRDGGLIDYHLDIPFLNSSEIVLYPHYTDRVIPGWFDKKLSWRKPDPQNMDNVLLVSPSRSFLEKLPYGKIPDRNDFKFFIGRNSERIDYWEKVKKEGEKLGDEFLEAVETGKIKELVKPMF